MSSASFDTIEHAVGSLPEVQNVRVAPRYRIRTPVTVFYQGEPLRAVTRNISMGGMCVALADQPSGGETIDLVDEQVTLSFDSPSEESLFFVEAVVRWLDSESGIGVQFTALDPDTARALERLLARG